MFKEAPFITATPTEAKVDDYIDLAWGRLPGGRTVNLVVINPDGDGGTIVVNTTTNAGYQYPVTKVGTYEFRLAQGGKILASTRVSVA